MRSALALAGVLVAGDAAVAASGDWNAVAFMYHRFGEDDFPSTSVTLDQFEAHLEHLDEEDYNVVPLAEIAATLRDGGTLPDRTVAITIDDAYRSIFDEAHQRLQAYDFPYTVFVATDPVDDGLSSYMSWEEMRELAEDGVDFANHTADHAYLVRREEGESEETYRERLRETIRTGQERLDDELGDAVATPALFAYPYGEYNEPAAEIAQDKGYVSFGQHSGVIGPNSDDRALPRFAMAEAFADIDDFAEKARALSLPVAEVEPWDPVAADADNPPRMRVSLAGTDARLDQLACFVGRQGAVDIEWVDRDERVFELEPPERLSRGRTRYNCTAPSDERGRFHWYSKQWIVPPRD